MVQREKGRKSSEGKQDTRTARGKRKATGIWTEMETKKAAVTPEKTQKEQGTER